MKADNLWNDVDALTRLALTGQNVELQSGGASSPRGPLPPSAFPPFRNKTGFAVHTAELPAQMVSGDYHDAFLLSDDRLVFVIADVSGKGVPAALLRGFLRSMVRNVSMYSDSPGDTLTRVNRLLYDANLGPMYVTIFLGWYDTKSGALRYANAGHPHPYRINRAGRASKFGEVTGPILGILDIERYDEREDVLGVGERLLLYTDGITEARATNGEFLGDDRLKTVLEEHASDPLGTMCDRILECVNAFQGKKRQDDATLFALQRNS